MDIEKTLDQACESSKAVSEMLDELARQNKAVTSSAWDACGKYFADVEQRQKRINTKLSELEKQKATLSRQVTDMKEDVVEASGTGDDAAFQQMQEKLASIEANKAAVSAQIEMLQSAHVRGDEKLYTAVCAAEDALNKANSEYREKLEQISPVVKEQAKIWDELERKSHYFRVLGNGFVVCMGGEVPKIAKVHENYKVQTKPDKK